MNQVAAAPFTSMTNNDLWWTHTQQTAEKAPPTSFKSPPVEHEEAPVRYATTPKHLKIIKKADCGARSLTPFLIIIIILLVLLLWVLHRIYQKMGTSLTL